METREEIKGEGKEQKTRTPRARKMSPLQLPPAFSLTTPKSPVSPKPAAIPAAATIANMPAASTSQSPRRAPISAISTQQNLKFITDEGLKPVKVIVSFYAEESITAPDTQEICPYIATNLSCDISLRTSEMGIKTQKIRHDLEEIIHRPDDQETKYGLKIYENPFSQLSIQVLSKGRYGWYDAYALLLTLLWKNGLPLIQINAYSLIRVLKAWQEHKKYEIKTEAFRQLWRLLDCIRRSSGAIKEEVIFERIKTKKNEVEEKSAIKYEIKLRTSESLVQQIIPTIIDSRPRLDTNSDSILKDLDPYCEQLKSAGSDCTRENSRAKPIPLPGMVSRVPNLPSDGDKTTADDLAVKSMIDAKICYELSVILFALAALLLLTLIIFATAHGGLPLLLPVLAAKLNLPVLATTNLIKSVLTVLLGGSILSLTTGVYLDKPTTSSANPMSSRCVSSGTMILPYLASLNSAAPADEREGLLQF